MSDKSKSKNSLNIIRDTPLTYIERGHKFAQNGKLKLAADSFRQAILLDPQLSIAYNGLGQVYQKEEKWTLAEKYFRKAISIDRKFKLAYKNLAAVLNSKGNYSGAKKILLQLYRLYPDHSDTLDILVAYAMSSGHLREAATYAQKFVELHSSLQREDINPGDALEPNRRFLSVPKLRHDIAQFKYLAKSGIVIKDIDKIVRNYTRVLKMIEPLGTTARVELDDSHLKLIGNYYNRILYRPHTPRVSRALSSNWNVVSSESDDTSPENDFKNSLYGLSVIDDFLSEKALAGLRKFCLESTIWFENKYAHGRLGAFFREGFNCPLLIQIGEEIKERFPNIIGDKHHLLQLWGFKCDHFQPPIPPHADFAAVNVNFWITPDEANLNPETGGMTIYNVEAPLSWDFDSYNNNGSRIIQFLKKNGAKEVTIPYKANRAIIFNSDLFHVTAPVQFKNSYDTRRINITLLYGKRENT